MGNFVKIIPKKEGIIMKKIIALLLTLILVVSAFASCKKAEEKNQDQTVKTEKTVIRLGGLKGPTSMGMVKLLEDNENDKTLNKYEFTMAGSADELTPKILKGELDVLAVPINLASVLYNKSNGGVKMIAVNMLGAVYIAEKDGNTVTDIKSLKGKTIYATGKGSTPEYTFAYLLSQNGLDINSDVTMVWKTEPTETVAEISKLDNAVAMIPQPYLSVAATQIPTLRTALDLNAEWDKLGLDSKFLTAGIIVNTDFAEKNKDAIKDFLKEYGESTKYVKNNVDEASTLIEKYEIVKAPIAKKALPDCNIVCITGDEMKTSVNGFLKVLYEQNPNSVGGKIPDKDFFLSYEK